MKKTVDSIAFQGDHGAYQELACLKHFPNYTTFACKSFEDVFLNVENSKVKLGMIPIENSYVGRVSEIHNLLQRTQLHITGEYFFKINHCLATIESSNLEKIKTVISHPMALMQCHNKINSYGLEISNEINTAIAAKKLHNNPKSDIAVICSEVACKLYNLKILQRNFQDDDNNYTHFVTIAKNPVIISSNVNAVGTILFELRNQSSALYEVLGLFAKTDINITKIESYIPGGISENAKFLLSFEGNPHADNIIEILENLTRICRYTKTLGFYKAAQIRLQKELIY
ncbi:MAG: prephenate dehydratase [Rickettsiales bacterium]|jgi:prephenate dehydratase|nr:prephenate dehydratase [Rickettsiales bacterium]